jgi:iron transport multicopper oxidase
MLISLSTAEPLKKCGFSCPGDVTQACGGDGTYMSVFYDRTKYVPGPDSIPGASSVSSSSSVVSSTISVSSGTGSSTVAVPTTTSSVSPITVLTSTTSSSSTVAAPTGPVIVQAIGAYSYAGCYTEATTGRALSQKIYANDNMTVEICYATCNGYAWFGIEYRRECRPTRYLVKVVK